MVVKEAQPTYNSVISVSAAKSLLRLSRALNCSLYDTLEDIINYIAQPQIKQKVCNSCFDKKDCLSCPFYIRNTPKSKLSVIVNGRYYDEY